MSSGIQNRFVEVSARIAGVAVGAGRDPASVQLVTVTKGQSALKIGEAIHAGATILGENYPEETHRKIIEMGESGTQPVWHMIGHLQSRKIKFIVDHFAMIHSIDTPEIALELAAKLQAAGRQMPALFEVNVSGEESKHGFAAWDESLWPALVDRFIALQNETSSLHFMGLMTMPPYADVPETSRPYFARCRKLLEFYQQRTGPGSFAQLSMGTSLDYEVAIAEGATFVRIGEAIMGPRVYS